MPSFASYASYASRGKMNHICRGYLLEVYKKNKKARRAILKNTILFFTLFLMLLAAGCTQNNKTTFKTHATPVGGDGTDVPPAEFINNTKTQRFFEIKCSLCHPLTRISSKEKIYDDWLMTLYSMKNHYGVLITEEEAILIALYINGTYSG
jgi:hypothetical protein